MSRSRSPIPDGEEMAAKTLNARLGIVGGLSILGTTGIVDPLFLLGLDRTRSIAASTWRARPGSTHVAGATGATSEAAVQKLYDLPEIALIDMGDFVGGMLKYLRAHPVPRVTIAGGVAKMTKLAQGMLDLHSKRGARRSRRAGRRGAGGRRLARRWRARIVGANTAAEAFALRRERRHSRSATRSRERAWETAAAVLRRRRHRARDRGVRPRRRAGRQDAISRPVHAASRPAEAALIVGVVERAVAEILRRERAADEDQRGALDRIGGDFAAMSPSVPRTMRSSGQLARTTTATGQSAP